MTPGAELELAIERPVAGGRMLARHEGRVVLVAGAIPGERVRARVERTTRQVMWAQAVEILDASADRREPSVDPACGGALYSHISYARQLQLKGEVIADAFRRTGKMSLPQPPRVAASPERGYRLRARLHVRNGRVGFFREGSHAICDAAATGQLHADAAAAVAWLSHALGSRLTHCDSLFVAENIAATERIAHLVARDDARLDDLPIIIPASVNLIGVTTSLPGRTVVLDGAATVSDSAAHVFGADSPVDAGVTWTRQAASFFQGNRFMVGALLRHVLAKSGVGSCVDLYSGVGLFAVALAAGGRRVIAVEGDPVSGSDLRVNAAPWQSRLRVVMSAVEEFVRHPLTPSPDVVVLDPPRSGVTPLVVDALVRWRAPRIVYVSCDPPTLARDARQLVAAGYQVSSVEAFDLFPNTPHVESVVTFESATSSAAPGNPSGPARS
jgi:23S rRNA (uracil1939-C5)-methyltransferase